MTANVPVKFLFIFEVECRFWSRSRVKKCFFMWSVSTRSRFFHILGFHLTSGKNRIIKSFEFLSSSGRSQF